MSACTVEVSIVPDSEQFWDATRPLCTTTGFVTFPDADSLEGKIKVERSTGDDQDGYVIRYDSEQPACSFWGQCRIPIISLAANGFLFLVMLIIFILESARFGEYQKKLQFEQVTFGGFATKVQ